MSSESSRPCETLFADLVSFVRIVSARVRVARAIVHSMGSRGVARRAAYVVAKRAGRLPIEPAPSGPPATLRDDWALPFEAVQQWWHGQAEETRRAAIDGLHRIRAGEVSIFGRPTPVELEFTQVSKGS